jgi:hypothetical protein
MAGSGVNRLRLARRGGGTNPREPNKGHGAGNRVSVNVNVGSGLAPKKNGPLMPQQIPGITPPPISNEQPSRGEAKVANPRRGAKH